MTKVYGIKGMTEVVVNVHTASGAFLRLRFTGGLPNKGNGMYPAIYMETNKIYQKLIEESREFKSGFIFIHKIYDNGEPDEPEVVEAPAPAPAPQAEEAVKEFPDVTTKEELFAVLKSQGAKATTLASDENVANFIKKKGLSFPNYQF